MVEASKSVFLFIETTPQRTILWGLFIPIKKHHSLGLRFGEEGIKYFKWIWVRDYRMHLIWVSDLEPPVWAFSDD